MEELTNEEICEEILVRPKTKSFFDIVISFPFQLITSGIIYYLGFYKTYPVWLLFPLILSILRDKWKLDRDLKKHIQMALDFQNECSSGNLQVDMLLPWTMYPDIERCEGINKLLYNLWPYVTAVLTDVVKNDLEPIIKSNFRYFTFKFVNFGDEPPLITGMKLYDVNINRYEIMFDVNLFYAGDCDIQFSLFGLYCGIQNVQVRGLVRIVIKPLMDTLPLCGGLEVTFLRKPKVDFVLNGVLGLLSMPVLKSSIRNMICDLISSNIVWPNKIYIPFVDNISDFGTAKFQEPLAVLKVNVVDAIDLVKVGSTSFFGKDDIEPYVLISFGDQTYQSINGDQPLSPKWNFWSEYVIDSPNDAELLVKVIKGEEFIGEVSLKIKSIVKEKSMDKWLELQNTERGEIHMKLYYCDLSTEITDYKDSIAKIPVLSSSIFMLHIDSAQNLLNPESKKKPNVQVSVDVGNQKKVLNTVLATNNPVFRQNVTFLLLNPAAEKLEMQFIDTSHSNKIEMGCFSFEIWQLLYVEGMEIIRHRYPLFEAASEASVVLSMKLKIIVRKDY